jgi:hypothetical protein
MEALDCPDPSLLSPKRNTTITALQALALLNNPFVLRQAEHLANRVAATSHDPAGQIEAAYQLAVNRAPRSEEMGKLLAYTHKHGLTNFCRVLLNSSEFMFVD